MTDWFEGLTGFREESYQDTRRRLAVVGDRLRSTVNDRSYAIGTLETPSVKELRAAAAPLVGGFAGSLMRDSGGWCEGIGRPIAWAACEA